MGLRDWAEKIRRGMSQLGDTQEAFARRLGVSPATLPRWVNGKNEPTPAMYVALPMTRQCDRPLRTQFHATSRVDFAT